MDSMALDMSQLKDYTSRKPRVNDNTLDDIKLEDSCILDNGTHSTQPQHSIGRLEVLPVETLTSILITLDLPTLTTIRRVSRRVMSLVDSLHQYATVLKHCPNVLRAIIAIDAKHYDCRCLYEKLFSTKCETCDRVGAYLYLITCVRVCYFCYTSDLRFFPVSVTYAAKETGIPKKEFERLPNIHSLPGRYTSLNKVSKRRIMLLDRQSVGDEFLPDSIRVFDEQRDLTTREPQRHMAIISAPFFTSSGQSADWGFYCSKCMAVPGLAFRNKFTEAGMLQHIRIHANKNNDLAASGA